MVDEYISQKNSVKLFMYKICPSLFYGCYLFSLSAFRLSRGWCSSHRSISFRESMPPSRDSVTHWPINWQSALIPSSSQELFFLVPFGSPADREPLASSTNRPLSHPLLLIPLGTLSLKNTLLLASYTLPSNPGPTYWLATQKGHFLTLTPLHLLR